MIHRFLRSEEGASAAEYALVLVVIGLGLTLSAANLGNSIGKAMGASANVIDPQAASNDTPAVNPPPAPGNPPAAKPGKPGNPGKGGQGPGGTPGCGGQSQGHNPNC